MGRKGYFSKDFNGTGYDPAWQEFAKGKGPFLIAGTWVTADLAKAMGDKVGFMLMPPAEEAEATRSRSAARTCRARSPRSPRTPTWRRPTSTSSPTRTPREGAGGHGQPAGDEDDARARRRRVGRTSPTAWQKLNEADGVIPYLDYTTPTFYDDISGGVQELLAGSRTRRVHVEPSRLHEVHGVARGGAVAATGRESAEPAARRRAVGERPPGEPRRVGYLYLLPAFAVFAAFVLLPLVHAAWISLYDWDGLTAGEWVGLDNYGGLHGPGAAHGVRARAGAADLLRRRCRS